MKMLTLIKLVSILLLFTIYFSVSTLSSRAAVIKTKAWEPNEFPQMSAEISHFTSLNFLNFPGAKCVTTSRCDNVSFLTDGNAGQCGGNGRVMINGSPSRIVYYLGRPRKIKEIRIWSGNSDSRSNQDYEIRVVNDTSSSESIPTFPNKPLATNGDKILGQDGGGFCSIIQGDNGTMLSDTPVNWVEFRIWRTHPCKAYEPGKSHSKAKSWSSLVELQVLGDENDPNLFASEKERLEWKKQQAEILLDSRLSEISPEISRSLKNMNSLRLMIEDINASFPGRINKDVILKNLDKFQNKFSEIAARDISVPEVQDQMYKLAEDYHSFRRSILLNNPCLDFKTLLLRKSNNSGFVSNWISSCDRKRGKYSDELVSLNMDDLCKADPFKKGADIPLTSIIQGPQDSFIGDICLNWDAKKLLVTALSEKRRWQIYEMNVDGTEMRQVVPDMGPDIDNAEGCYAPDGSILFCSSASMMGIPCISGKSLVANIFRIEKDGKTIRQLTFEQDQDWFPTLMNNGRIMYLRWEYTDSAHLFTRILFSMNPDGTNQVALYGSNSYWPNSLFYAKPIPGHPTKFVGIVSGHHGVSRIGELYVFDPKIGTKEADGVVQQIPGYGKPVKPRIEDQLVDNSWPKFVHPTPLSDHYFLVNCQLTPQSRWGLYLVDIYDNMLLLYENPSFCLYEPTPLLERQVPPTIPHRFQDGEKEATAFITDVYFGPGLKDVPRGTVKKLRLLSYQYGYRGIGGHTEFGLESSWDAKRIIGEVPVNPDGSATFKIPANTPLSLQPLDENGEALQIMRSWLVAMPGERMSCIGCHEMQNSVTPSKRVTAMLQEPGEITPFYGPARGYGFARDVQPVLDKYCSGCHNGEKENLPNFYDISIGAETFSNSYHALARYVRRPGPESDVEIFYPMEYHASTSELIQILNKGHHNVKLDKESWEKLVCWIDCNAPYHASWMDVARAQDLTTHVAQMASRTQQLRELYANIEGNPEEDSAASMPKRVAFIKPEEIPDPDPSAPELKNWPFKVSKKVSADESRLKTLNINGIELKMVNIPSGKFVMGDYQGDRDEYPRREVEIQNSFWMSATEVTNELYAQFNPQHDSRYIDQWWKDHTIPGYPANLPDQPVIRISWLEAQDFCKWLSEKTGKKFRLPTEAEWEWAARAGNDQPFWFGGLDSDFTPYANFSDVSTRLFYVRGINPRPVKHADYQAWIPRSELNDGNMTVSKVASYKPNPWGIYDMNGNVAEWTQSDYKPYPYKADDGRNNGTVTEKKTVRGGSWYERPIKCRSGMRLPYQPWQKVYNVGIRLVCEE